MSTNEKYLAVMTGSPSSPRHKAWNALSEPERQAKVGEGMKAWQAWMEKNQAAIVDHGGPLGKTKRVSNDGVKDVTNELAAFVIVRAPSHEAAAKMFEGHPHFAIFPGEAVEVMPLLPVPSK